MAKYTFKAERKRKYHHTAVCKERANAPRTSTLSMGIEKAGAYESSLGSIFGRCVKAF